MCALLSLSTLSLGITFSPRSIALNWLFGKMKTKNPENGELAAKKENQTANKQDKKHFVSYNITEVTSK